MSEQEPLDKSILRLHGPDLRAEVHRLRGAKSFTDHREIPLMPKAIDYRRRAEGLNDKNKMITIVVIASVLTYLFLHFF